MPHRWNLGGFVAPMIDAPCNNHNALYDTRSNAEIHQSMPLEIRKIPDQFQRPIRRETAGHTAGRRQQEKTCLIVNRNVLDSF